MLRNDGKARARAIGSPWRRKRARSLRRSLLIWGCQLLVVVILLGSWQLLVDNGVLDEFTYGKPSSVWSELMDWVHHGTQNGSLTTQVWVTTQEAVLGFLFGGAAGVLLGVALGRVRLLAEVFGPFIRILNAFPAIVLGSVFMIWFGLGIESKVWLAALLVFFGVFYNAFQGTREVDRNLAANARILGANHLRVTFQVAVPSALSWIIASLHVAFGMSLIGAIVGEMLGSSKGLGNIIYNAQQSFDMNGVFAGLLIIAVVALIAEGLITLLERWLLRWRPSHGGGDR
jgi:NitT/TauT family transport system permease protein